MAAAIPNGEPSRITRGNTVKWYKTVADYPAGGSDSLAYSVRGPVTIIDGDVSVSASGTDYLATITAAKTSDWTAGVYWWEARITTGGEIYTVDSGTFEVVKSPAENSGTYDGRTQEKIDLDVYTAAYRALLTNKVQSYTLNGRTFNYHSIDIYRGEIDRLQAIVNNQKRSERIANGKRVGKVHVKFTTPV